jgi:hypothetical protein
MQVPPQGLVAVVAKRNEDTALQCASGGGFESLETCGSLGNPGSPP